MPNRRWTQRGATAVEYALGAGLLAVAMLIGFEAARNGADEGYDDRQALVATGVTDPGSPSVPTTAGPVTTVTLPPELTTTTTAVAPPTSTASATASSIADSTQNWRAVITITIAPPTPGATASGTYAREGFSGTTSWECTVGSGGTCSFTTGDLRRNGGQNAIDWVDFTTTSITGGTPPFNGALPGERRATRP